MSALTDSSAFLARIVTLLGPSIVVTSPEHFQLRPLEEDFQDVLREIRRARALFSDPIFVELVRDGNLAVCHVRLEDTLLRGLPIALIEPS